MTQKDSFSPQIDPVAERRRALAKVYRLLLRLAEEAENNAAIADIAVTSEEKTGEPVSVIEEELNQ
jgi:hypothetical protein